MSEETKTNEPVKQEGDFKIKSKPKVKKFNDKKDEPIKVDLTKDVNVKIEEPIKVDLTKKTRTRCHSSRRNKEGGCGRTSRRWRERGHWRRQTS